MTDRRRRVLRVVEGGQRSEVNDGHAFAELLVEEVPVLVALIA
jgi:hypothetical protein